MADLDLIPPDHLRFVAVREPKQWALAGDNFVSEYLIRRGKMKPTDDVLDLGSGNGQKARPLARYLTTGSYTGLDVLKDCIEWCSEAYRPLSRFTFIHADIRSSHYNPEGVFTADSYRLPFEDHSFDFIFLSSLFTHLLPPEVENYVREIKRVARRGAHVVITAFLINNLSRNRAANGVIGLPYDKGIYRLRDESNPSSAVGYDEEWLRNLLAANDLPVREITFGNWTRISDLLAALQDVMISLRIE
jgi:SAM-dependent methyltransferase